MPCFLSASLIFSVQNIIVKELSGIYPIMEFVFFRTPSSIPLVRVIAFMDAGSMAFRRRRPAARPAHVLALHDLLSRRRALPS